MTSDEALALFDGLNTWRQGDQRPPHKPLLVLSALGRWQQGKAEVTFLEAEPDLTALLREFGPPRKSDHPEQPFWRLKNDGVWSVQVPAVPSAVTACHEAGLERHGPADEVGVSRASITSK
jgi:putative restriction endonuclease